MNIGSHGSEAYQSQMSRYAEAIKNAREKKNGGNQENVVVHSSVQVIDEKGEVIGWRETLAGSAKDARSGGYVSSGPFVPSPDMKEINIMELLEKARAECPQPIDLDKAQVAVFTPKPLRLTGDDAYDRCILAGFEYQKSCVDTSGGGVYYAMKESEDFTGMSRTEIYRCIYYRYTQNVGEHFLDERAVSFFPPPDSDDDKYLNVLRMFDKEVMDACGAERHQIPSLRKEALYPGMTDSEVRQTIIDDYKKRYGNNMTNTELCRMVNEMYECGVDGGLKSMLNYDGNMFIYGNPNSDITGIPYDHAGAQQAWLGQKVSNAVFDNVRRTYQNKLMVGAPVDPQLGYMIEYVRSEVLPKVKIYG